MEWLIVAAIIGFLIGLLLMFSSEALRVLSDLMNKPLAYLDNMILAVRMPAGIVFIILGGWLISVAFSYPELWYLHLAGALALFFGLVYLFVPQWLSVFSKVSDQLVMPTDEMVLGMRKGIGVVLVIAALYILYVAYLLSR